MKGRDNMEFNNKLYDLRKQKGLSQEELANRLNVSRQTISKWEIGDSTPDMEKLVAISDLFGISLDELVLDKAPETVQAAPPPARSELYSDVKEHILTDKNKKKAKKGLKIAAVIGVAVLLIDMLSLLLYVIINGGFPK